MLKIKILTTPEYLDAHDAYDILKGEDVQVLLGYNEFNSETADKFSSHGITPEFILTTGDNIDFLTGYILGCTLQGSCAVIVLTDKVYKIPVFIPKYCVISNDIASAKAELAKREQKFYETTVVSEQATSQSGEISSTGVVSVDPVTGAEVPAQPVKSKRGRKPKPKIIDPNAEPAPKRKRGRKRKVVLDDMSDQTADDEVFKAVSYDELRKLLTDCGAIEVARRYNIDEARLLDDINYCLNTSYEVVSYKIQLEIRFSNTDFTDEFYAATKRFYDRLKKSVTP